MTAFSAGMTQVLMTDFIRRRIVINPYGYSPEQLTEIHQLIAESDASAARLMALCDAAMARFEAKYEELPK